MDVFITDGEQRSALAAVRALGSAGVSVAVGASGRETLAGRSRFCGRAVVYPSPVEHPAAFQEFLRSEMLREKYRLLLPMTDIAIKLTAEVRESLPQHLQASLPTPQQIELVQNKPRTLELAREHGVACPQTYRIDGAMSVADLPASIHYPVVVKPRSSKYFDGKHWIAVSVRFAQSADELISIYREMHALVPFPIVQEMVEGEGRGVFLLVWQGELKAAFCHRRLREKPPWGGVSVYCESLPLEEPIVERSLSLLRAIGWQGPAMVEYKIDTKDQQPKLMEVNGRFWGSLQLAIDSGVNFPFLLYKLATGEPVPPQTVYKVGRKSRWVLGDLDNLLIRLRNAYPATVPAAQKVSKLQACFNFLSPERDTRSEVFRLSDPKPGWFELEAYVRDLWHGLRHTRERAHAH